MLRPIAIALAVSLAAAPQVAARRAVVDAPREDAGVAVLGLDADDPAIGSELTIALRRATGDARVDTPSFADARHTQGCRSDDAECLARIGRSLGARQLMVGRMRQSGEGYVLELATIDVDAATFAVRDRFPLTGEQVRRPELERTADVIAAAMLDTGDAAVADRPTAAERPPSPRPELPPTASPREPTAPTPTRVPRWKPAMFGVSLALTGVGLVGAVTLSFLTRPDGKLDRDIDDAMAASLQDSKMSNDVPPGTAHPCDYAAEQLEPGGVRNAPVTRACRRRDNGREAAGAVWAASAVLAATTVVFAALWHKHFRNRDRAVARRRASLGLGPDGRGGIAVAGGFRF